MTGAGPAVRLTIRLLTATVIALAMLVVADESHPAFALTFTVDSTADNADSNTGDGVCDDGSGACTLRAAIEQANATAATDVIEFSIGAGAVTIDLVSGLPSISRAVTIDGTTQSGFVGTPLIELNGLNAGAGVDGLRITAGSSTVMGLVINRFRGDGIQIDTNGGNTIEGNFIGTDKTGTVVDPGGLCNGDEYGNFVNGILIQGSSSNTIGGSTAAARNIISGNGRGCFGSGGDGVEIAGTNATGNVVSGNYIGTDVTGELDRGNTENGVLINNARTNTIGAAGAGNVISGNNKSGVQINGSGAKTNKIQGNFIGTIHDGTDDLANSADGVSIVDAPSNTVGGTTAGARNIIAGNSSDGIEISGGEATGNLVQGNYIGTDVLGTSSLRNLSDGVELRAPGNVIGGTTAGARNIISGNGTTVLKANGVRISGSAASGNLVQGNYIGTDVSGALPLGNSDNGVRIIIAPNNTIGGTSSAARNIISANGDRGVEITSSSASGNKVQGNYIGTDLTGTAAVANGKDGIFIDGAPNTRIGGTSGGARNLISGNGDPFLSSGILILGSAASGTIVRGNYIGTDVTGAVDLGNSYDGIFISGAPNSIIGGTVSGSRNIISGNGTRGVEIFDEGATGNLVQGNYIGTDVDGTTAMGNIGNGIFISGAPGNTIGGTTAEARNIISANNAGVEIFDTAAKDNKVQGNFIGTDVDGTTDLGNTLYGVFINGAPRNTIGGATSGARNVISGNDDAGIFISGSGAKNNKVDSNYIGTTKGGAAALGNTFDGVRVGGVASNNTIGGNPGNVIAFNGGNGVLISDAPGNAIRRNSIFANTGLGIDLGDDGVTLNDAGDGDSGANGLQNFPVITSSTTGGSTTVKGTLNSKPSITYILDFFGSSSCDPSTYGEGRTYLGSGKVTTNGSGNASFTFNFDVAIADTDVVTSTTTSAANNTSEFSKCEGAVIGCNGLAATIIGDDGPNVLNGTAGKDVIVALGGDDVVRGFGGDDVICGGKGNDLLIGGGGNDKLFGEGGDDRLQGNAGNDLLNGGIGIDTGEFVSAPAGVTANLSTGAAGGEGSDTLKRLENLTGGPHNDKLTGNGSANTLKGRDGNDELNGQNGNDKVYGGIGGDAMDGGGNTDLCDGGAGPDTAVRCENVISVP
ncbi:MAG: CSLREA domain-containing protein [Chloroflexi bacterium]|nr:CSLREA domain-containing protein [Chloroflexota bacterium]